MAIHPSAHIDPKAQIDPTVEIGPNAVVEGLVRVGSRTKIYPNAYVSGWTTVGADCEIHPGAIVGHLPQDFHFGGERTYCEVGDGTIIREFASVHRGTQPESKTIIGKRCYLLAYSHVGHNCELGDEVKVYNCTALSGHVEVGARAIVSGYTLVLQFTRIGELAMIGGGARLTMDAPPFMKCVGESECCGPNGIGLQRAGFSAEDRAAVREAYRILYRSGVPFRTAIETLRASEAAAVGPVRRLIEFVSNPGKNGVCGPTKDRRRRNG
jgi:UDP-N-acetylglucosamine acyltransferase